MGDKNVPIEKIYQKKSQLEHILLRPDTYIGSVEPVTQEMWIWDFDAEKMIKKEITFVPGLYKIFDEILVNAADNKQRDPNMSIIRVNIDKASNTIKVYNNGRGIPVTEHKDEKVFVPTLIFGHLLTSSNYNDDEKKVTGGRNGYGAKLCNIFSKKFTIETSSKEYKKTFKQVWSNNMSKAEEPIIKEAKDDDYTCVTFQPDLEKFKMDKLDGDMACLMARRAYDIAATSGSSVKVFLNDKRLPIAKFEDYCKLYLEQVDDCGNEVKILHEKCNPRWEIAIACSDIGFQQVSFVNSIATSKGGRHVDYISDQLVKAIGELVNKKNKGGNPVKPFQIKNYMWVFINCLIENPTFDSQTKENMTLQSKSFGSKCQLSDDFMKKVAKCGLVEKILNWLAFKEKTDLEKTGPKSKQSKIRGIPKLDDANDAGTKESMNCTLILTEGDSAKTLAVSGLGVIGRDKYGVFPLRGKMLNVREATTKQILENSEVTSLCKIIGLNFKEKYETRESLKQLRYGKLMIMTDQDHDGSHIKGLIINFVHHKWPNLLKHNFVEEFITPIVKVSKNNREISFYSMPEFTEWQNNTENWQTWKLKYYKGLGTSTSKEAKEYFSDMNRHRIKFEYASARDDLAIQLAFSKKLIEERKDWLTRFMEERKSRREANLSDDYLYQKNTTRVNYTDFINKELVLFSNLDNERSIPSLVDGFKPGQRKVLFSCFKRNLHKEIKVAQLAGSVAELSAYHHGEASLMGTIINLAQNFVGSNNINLLLPIGQFGTRLHGGKDAASSRYIFTSLSPLTRLLFNPKDDPLYTYLNDDGLKVEPEWYCPIIPMVLVNGAEGIGTGWSTKIPNYNPREIIDNLKRLLKKQDTVAMKPFYKNYRGKIERTDDIRFTTNGEVAVIGDNTVEITELPVSVWTQAYKESVLEPFLHGQEKQPACIHDYKEYHTDTTVRFIVKFTPEQFTAARQTGLHKFFKLQKSISINSMVLFDHNGCLRRYDSVTEILKEFFEIRVKLYDKRKKYLEGTLTAESLKLDNIARFILEKIEGKVKVENLKKTEIIRILKERNYLPDPVAKWREKCVRENGYDTDDRPAEEETESQEESSKKDYDYLLGMPIWNLTMEKKDDILRQQKEKGDELRLLREKSPETLWLDDLDQFLVELNKFEAKEKEDEIATQAKTFKAANAGRGGSSKSNKNCRAEYLPDPLGERVEPVMDIKSEPSVKQEKLIKRNENEINFVDIITGRVEEVRTMDDRQIIELANKLLNPTKEKKTATAAEKPASKGVKKEKVDSGDVKIETISDGDDDSNEPVASIFKKKQTVTKEPKAAKVPIAAAKDKKEPAKKNQSSLDNYFNKKSKKKVNESEAEDDDEGSDGSFIEEIGGELDDSTNREPRQKRNRAPISYRLDADDDSNSKKDDIESIDDFVLDESGDSNVEVKAANKKSKGKKAKSDDDDESEKNAAAKKKPEAKASTAAKKTGSGEKPKSKPKQDKVEDKENKPAAKAAVESKKAAKTDVASKPKATKKGKYTYGDTDDSDTDVIIGDSDDDDYEKPRTKPKKKLMDKNDDETTSKKRKKAMIPSDEDLYAID